MTLPIPSLTLNGETLELPTLLNAPHTPTNKDTPITCPIHQRDRTYHVYLGHNKRMAPMVVTGATADGLRNGRLCTFIRNDGRPFTGRVTRLIEHQRTRLLLQVTHVNSLARFSLVVPYELYYSPKKARFFRWIEWWIWSDSEGQVKGE